MEALDNPKQYVFERAGIKSDGSHDVINKAAWADTLRGRAAAQFFGRFLPFAKVAAYKKKKQSVPASGKGMVVGVREGKASPPAAKKR
jgi:hypothetical protein